jgi:hypothetical protein
MPPVKSQNPMPHVGHHPAGRTMPPFHPPAGPAPGDSQTVGAPLRPADHPGQPEMARSKRRTVGIRQVAAGPAAEVLLP